jgi:phosphohistidine phosphatase SixA
LHLAGLLPILVLVLRSIIVVALLLLAACEPESAPAPAPSPSSASAEQRDAALGEPTTLILVRHAEKADDSEDPPLTDEGRARALELHRVLSDVDVGAVYSTPFVRTRGTVRPIAEEHGLKIRTYDAASAADEVRAILKRHPGETVLIVGHKPSVPAMLNALLGEEKLPKLKRYDDLFVVSVPPTGTPDIVHLHYGAPH